METNKYTNPFEDGGQLSLSQPITDEQKWRYWLEVIDRGVINDISHQLQGFEQQNAGRSVNYIFRCPFCWAQQKTAYEKTRVTACLRETGGRAWIQQQRRVSVPLLPLQVHPHALPVP